MSLAETIGDQRAVRGTSSPVLGMVLFVASEAMFFAALFGAYFTIYAGANTWPPKGIETNIGVPAVLTAILVSSSFTLQAGVAAVRKGRMDRLKRWLEATLLLGIAFLALQAYDYSQLNFAIRQGAFPSLFYVMTGLHMAHVIGGVVLLGMVYVQSRTDQLSMERHEPVESAAIYWHFVDVVWIGLFSAFYLATMR
ncbi:MAG: cytochrome c oxidase subunit [Actinomycetota bacterium]|jgi:cytochrome c oxidase subunit 3|nr:cytochrome c oxidase subunit [Actinomycetota bacterium]